MHNTGIYLTLLILLCLCLCSNYTPSGISPGKIPSHPSHSAVLIAAALQVRTHANFPVKDSESDGKLTGCTAGGGGGVDVGLRGVGGYSTPVLSSSPRDSPAWRLWTCQCPVISNVAASLWLCGCECAQAPSPVNIN